MTNKELEKSILKFLKRENSEVASSVMTQFIRDLKSGLGAEGKGEHLFKNLNNVFLAVTSVDGKEIIRYGAHCPTIKGIPQKTIKYDEYK